jgi:hypothetical protein
MNDEATLEFQREPRHIKLAEKEALLRVLQCMRVYCARCPIESPGFDRDPCYGCIVLPLECRRPMTTVN